LLPLVLDLNHLKHTPACTVENEFLLFTVSSSSHTDLARAVFPGPSNPTIGMREGCFLDPGLFR